MIPFAGRSCKYARTHHIVEKEPRGGSPDWRQRPVGAELGRRYGRSVPGLRPEFPVERFPANLARPAGRSRAEPASPRGWEGSFFDDWLPRVWLVSAWHSSRSNRAGASVFVPSHRSQAKCWLATFVLNALGLEGSLVAACGAHGRAMMFRVREPSSETRKLVSRVRSISQNRLCSSESDLHRRDDFPRWFPNGEPARKAKRSCHCHAGQQLPLDRYDFQKTFWQESSRTRRGENDRSSHRGE